MFASIATHNVYVKCVQVGCSSPSLGCEPIGDKPLKLVMQRQSDARPMVTFLLFGDRDSDRYSFSALALSVG